MASSPAQLFERVRGFLLDGLWKAEYGPQSWMGWLVSWLQLGALIVRGFVDDKLLLRASALTYITSLSIVPVLVVLISVIDWLGLSRGLVELGAKQFLASSPDAVERILGVVESANIGAFGSVGGAIFLVTTILSLRHVEETFNEIWGAIQGRSWLRRFTNYLAVLISVPLVLGTLVSISGDIGDGALAEQLEAMPMADVVRDLATGVGPLAFLFLSFTVVYFVLPNTPVRVLSAAIGGAVAAVLFVSAQYVYVSFSIGAARYDSLFGGFAIVPLLLVWIYVSWSIVLLGAEIAYAHQNLARYRREARDSELEPAELESVGLRLLVELARGFRDGWPPESADRLSTRLGSSLRTVANLLVRFERVGLVTLCGAGDGESQYQLGRAAASIELGEVFLALRGRRQDRVHGGEADTNHTTERRVEDLLAEVQEATAALRARTLLDVIEPLPRREPPARAGRSG